MVSILLQFQTHTRSKEPLKRGCIKQQYDRENDSILDLLYNDRDFAIVEICLIKIVMYLNDYSIVDVE